MSVFRRGRVYHYEFEFARVRYRGTTRMRTRAEALAVEAALRARLRRQAMGLEVPEPPTPRLQEWAEVHLAHVAPELKHPEAHALYIEVLLRFFGARPADNPHPDDAPRRWATARSRRRSATPTYGRCTSGRRSSGSRPWCRSATWSRPRG